MLRVVKKGGMIFVDYPSTKDEHFGKGEEIEKNTFVGGVEGEEMMPHHYTEQRELEHLYQAYTCEIEPYTYYYQYEGVDYPIEAYTVVLSK